MPSDIINADTEFINKIGLKDHLSPTRANGLVSMVKQLKNVCFSVPNTIKLICQKLLILTN